ncbi:MAG: cysteine desulfurase [Saccharofermentans sp.]|nr:cysteine desulfurase [Saccharofermentans sp.]
MDHIYLDHAATTRPDTASVEAMLPYLNGEYQNPSAIYQPAVKIRAKISSIRADIAGFLNTSPSSIFFTSGGTESDNWAVRGAAHIMRSKGRHIISTSIEHPAVLNTLKSLESEGYEVTYLPVDKNGIVSVSDIEAAIKDDTILISVMHANNEIGTIEPVEQIGRIANGRGILFHVDAVQTFGHIPIDVEKLNVDFLSASSHKIYGPKGCGILYIKNPSSFVKILYGGSQENGMRPGTENVPAIMGFGEAVNIARTRINDDLAHDMKLRKLFMDKLTEEVPGVKFNGSKESVLPGILSVTFEGVTAETLLIILDSNGICASAGSACAAGAIEPSHVLMSCGMDKESASRTVRFSTGRENTEEDIIFTVKVIGDYFRGRSKS